MGWNGKPNQKDKYFGLKTDYAYRNLTVKNLLCMSTLINLPPLPEINNLMEMLPQQTDPILIGTSTQRILFYADSNNTSHGSWVCDTPSETNLISNAVLKCFWPDGNNRQLQPREYTLTHRRYWQQVPSTYTQVPFGGKYEKSYTATHGISAENQQSIGAELGVEYGGLSAKLTATFSQSITTSNAESVTTTYSCGSPESGSIRVWVMWQLVDEIAALDVNGNVIAPSDGRQGDVWWNDDKGGCSGAYLNYRNVQQAFPTSICIPVQKDFPA